MDSVKAFHNKVFLIYQPVCKSAVCVCRTPASGPPGCSGGGAVKGKRSCNYVCGIWIPPLIPSVAPHWLICQISVNQREAERAQMYNCKQTLKTWKLAPKVIMSLVMSSPPIKILQWLFWCRYSNSGDVVASSPSFSRSTARALWRACSQAIIN